MEHRRSADQKSTRLFLVPAPSVYNVPRDLIDPNLPVLGS